MHPTSWHRKQQSPQVISQLLVPYQEPPPLSRDTFRQPIVCAGSECAVLMQLSFFCLALAREGDAPEPAPAPGRRRGGRARIPGDMQLAVHGDASLRSLLLLNGH
mmetsp:Transcript_29079/g.48354  ORF Transcript_29079/g.48354 Transcript_29079/m.48354 type:complete len:105 (-) Transcript_29079:716-1030(-)